ncbi:MAG: hypothetical protein AAF708_23310 [Deinococcota bacterium]
MTASGDLISIDTTKINTVMGYVAIPELDNEDGEPSATNILDHP